MLDSILVSSKLEVGEVLLITGNKLLKPACPTSTTPTDIVLYVIEALILCIATYLSYKTRDVPSAINESKTVALSKSNLKQSFIISPMFF